MRAVLQSTYGTPDVLSIGELPVPEVGDDEVLVRVHAAALGKGDAHALSGKPYMIRLMGYGFRKLKNPVPGHEIAGRVEAVGKDVTELRPGDDVYGEIKRGALAEYASVAETSLAPMPRGLSYAQAAAVPVSGMTALQAMRDVAKVEAGDKVLINGASGGVGTYAIQIAKHLGAHVTGVCSTRNVEQARALGADDVIDYTQEDFADRETQYDVVFDVVGNRPLKDIRRVLKRKGTYVSAAAPMGNWLGPIVWMLKIAFASLFGSRRMVTLISMPKKEDLLYLNPLLEAGTIVPAIERTYTLEEAPEALRYVATGHARGKLVIEI